MLTESAGNLKVGWSNSMDIGVVMLVIRGAGRLKEPGADPRPVGAKSSCWTTVHPGWHFLDLLRERLGIEPIDAGRDAGTFFSKSETQSGLACSILTGASALMRTSGLDPSGLDALRKNPPPDGAAGLFQLAQLS